MTEKISSSTLDLALALVDFGACRDSDNPAGWVNVASPMCAHCIGTEDVNLAAARIIAGEYRKMMKDSRNNFTKEVRGKE